MNIEILKYSIKVWLASFALSFPIAIIGIRLYGKLFVEADLFMYDTLELFFFALGKMLGFGIGFLFVLCFGNEFINNRMTNTVSIKQALTGVIIAPILLVIYDNAKDHFFFFFNIENVQQLVFFGLLIVFIWVIKLRRDPIEMENILDA